MSWLAGGFDNSVIWRKRGWDGAITGAWGCYHNWALSLFFVFSQGLAECVREFPKVLVVNGGAGEQTGWEWITPLFIAHDGIFWGGCLWDSDEIKKNKKKPKTIQFFTCSRLLGCCLFDTASSSWHRWVWTQRMSVLEPFFFRRFDVFLEFLLEIDGRGTRCCSVTHRLDATLVAGVTNMDVSLRDK